MNNIRFTIDWKEIVEKDLEEFKEKLYQEYVNKGHHSAISNHEICGIIDEEFGELKAAIHSEDEKQVVKELFDILIATMWGINSIERERK